MQPVRFDHFITYTRAPTIEDHLADYRRAGFQVLDRTTRHAPGLRNGFVGFGPDYLEFCWVEDEGLFAAGDPRERAWRDAVRPYGIGLVTADVQALHDEWVARGYELPPVWSGRPRDAAPDATPVWSFLDPPPDMRPGGALCFVLTYHVRRQAPREPIAANTSFAIAGVTFVTSNPAERARAWGRLFAPAEVVQTESVTSAVAIGPHLATWMTPAEYERRYRQPWHPSPHAEGELAALHVLAEDLVVVEEMLAAAGRHIVPIQALASQPAGLFVAPDPRDGVAFIMTERVAADWSAWRTAITGEQLNV
jgi:hypothetical protein